jgi:hypothetical protein
VIGFEDEAIGVAEMHFDEFGHVAEVGDEGELGAVGTKGEADGVGGIVRDGEGVDIDITDGEALAGRDGFDATKALAESIGEAALERVHRGLGDVEWSFPEAKHLWEAAAVVGMFVGDEDAVEMVDGSFDGGEAGESFPFAKAGVNEDAGTLGLEQGDVARAARRQDGNAQADRLLLKNCRAEAQHLHKHARTVCGNF